MRVWAYLSHFPNLITTQYPLPRTHLLRIGAHLTTFPSLYYEPSTHGSSLYLVESVLHPSHSRGLPQCLQRSLSTCVPTGEGETIKKALEHVSTLSVSELPVIPELANAPESWRRVAALHRGLSRRCANKSYFLSCRDAAKASPGLSHQAAYNINLALAQLGVIKIVRIGDPGPNGRASRFRYLLPQTENGAPQADGGRASENQEEEHADDCPF
jgi:hypothetical protein